MTLDRANQLFTDGRLHTAFVEYLVVATDEQDSPANRAEAWLQMGLIARFNPALCPEGSESGIFYWQKAVDLDPEAISAWHSIVQDYGHGPVTHQDVLLAREGLRRLRLWEAGRSGVLAEGVRGLIRNKPVEYPELNLDESQDV